MSDHDAGGCCDGGAPGDASGGGAGQADADDPAGGTAGTDVWRSDRAIRTWIAGVLTVAGLLLEFVLSGPNLHLGTLLGSEVALADALFLLAVASGGRTILVNGYDALRARRLGIDLLMSIAIVGALVASVGFDAGLYMEAALLAVLFNLAELLEDYSIDRARQSLHELIELAPETATVRRDTGSSETPRADGEAVEGEAVTVPVEDVAVGEVVLVRPGDQIPMDGTVIEGESAVNQAPITGESVPVDKVEGDEVYAGTINESGYLEVRTTAEADDNTLSRIVDLVESAQAGRTEHEQFVDRFADYYTPTVVVLGLVTALVPPLVLDGAVTVAALGVAHTFVGAWDVWFLRGLTLLVLACPCAFVISTPVSVVSGITSGARNGVLVKGGHHLEAMGEIDVVAMDKTGTITRGELTVTDVIPVNGNSEADVLRCARGLESRSEHPIGEAIVEHAEERRVAAPGVDDFESITGKGVQADIGAAADAAHDATDDGGADEADGGANEADAGSGVADDSGAGGAATAHPTQHYAGKPGLFDELGFDLDHVHAATDGGVVTRKSKSICERNDCLDLYGDLIPELQSQGKTVVLIGTEAEIEGVIAVADEVRPEAAPAVARLHDLGVERVVMLTGDNDRTAAAIAAQVDVDEHRAELLPDEKVEAIRELDEETDGGVAMVGDGVNDAPALATATVGIAMGAAGTDTAIETADVALMGDDLSRLPYLYDLSGRATGVIRQNVWSSLGVKALLAAGVPFGLVPIWAAVLIGDAGMTVGVTGNAMRLSRVAPEELGEGDG